MQTIRRLLSCHSFYFTYIPVILAIATGGLYFENTVINFIASIFFTKTGNNIISSRHPTSYCTSSASSLSTSVSESKMICLHSCHNPRQNINSPITMKSILNSISAINKIKSTNLQGLLTAISMDVSSDS